MIALVFLVTALLAASGEINRVAGSTSTSTVFAPSSSTIFALATKVFAGTITSSPSPIPMAIKVASAPLVQLLASMAWGAPKYSASCFSTCWQIVPVVKKGVSKTSAMPLASALES